MTEDEIRAATVGDLEPLSGPIQIVDYDPRWPELFQREAERIRESLGERALLVEHVGSTAVPGLAAKPRIDILLVVADSADELTYLPVLAAAGYALRVREPNWYEHRMLRGPDTGINLHVFSAGCSAVGDAALSLAGCPANVADMPGRPAQSLSHYLLVASPVLPGSLSRITMIHLLASGDRTRCGG